MAKQTSGQPYRHYDDMAVLDYIDTYQKRRGGRSPSQRHLHRALNMSSASTAHNIVRRLERNKLVVLHPPEPGLAGEMEITQAGQYTLIGWRSQRKPPETTTEPAAPLATPAGGAAHIARGAA